MDIGISTGLTIGLSDIALYAFALVVLVATPGPVVVATVARALTGGWRSALPLSGGVSIGDMIWPLLAIFGLAAVAHVYGEVMLVLRYVGAGILIWMGWRLLSGRAEALEASPDPDLMRRNAWEGFMAGLLVSLGNPKAIFFFVGVLPSFFDMTALSPADVAIIVALSALVPFLGNVVWALAAHGARDVLATPRMVRRVNQASGGALTGAGVYIAASG